jgi:adenylate cyclase
LWVLGANLMGVVVVGTYINIVTPFPSTSTAVTIAAWGSGVLFVALACAIAVPWFARAFATASLFVTEQRAPTHEERSATLGFSTLVTRVVLASWAIAATADAAAALIDPGDIGRALQVGVAVLLGGITTALASQLLLERAFRPLYALVVSDDDPDPSTRLGIAQRLLLCWALGSGIPLLILVVAPIGGTISRGRMQSLNWYFGSVGLAAGAVLVLIAARSVADPIRGLRHGMRTVRNGSLDVSVSIADAGEVGQVQAGFNRMVDGLRERQRLEDLFGRHVGVEVARVALERGVDLGGETQEVSLLFVDLIASTTLAQQLPPTEVVDALNRFFGAVVKSTHSEGGWINKFEGDAALCVFGAPNPTTDHAVHALRAARSLRDALQQLGRAHVALNAGIGVSSGVVVAGNVGSAERYEYTVIGDPVNEAARLTEVAKQRPERVLASAAAVGAAPSEAQNWTKGDCFTLRGRTTPTQTFVPVVTRTGPPL